MTATVGDALAGMDRTERLARDVLALLSTSVIGAPQPGDDLGLWLAYRFDRYHTLSGGEQILWNVALAIYNGHEAVHVADLGRLDADNRRAVAAIIGEWLT